MNIRCRRLLNGTSLLIDWRREYLKLIFGCTKSVIKLRFIRLIISTIAIVLTWRSIVCYLLFKKNPQTKSCDLETARDLIVQYCETPGISFDGCNSGTREEDDAIGRCCNGDEAAEACARDCGGGGDGLKRTRVKMIASWTSGSISASTI
jgi:hypothetical protein